MKDFRKSKAGLVILSFFSIRDAIKMQVVCKKWYSDFVPKLCIENFHQLLVKARAMLNSMPQVPNQNVVNTFRAIGPLSLDDFRKAELQVGPILAENQFTEFKSHQIVNNWEVASGQFWNEQPHGIVRILHRDGSMIEAQIRHRKINGLFREIRADGSYTIG